MLILQRFPVRPFAMTGSPGPSTDQPFKKIPISIGFQRPCCGPGQRALVLARQSGVQLLEDLERINLQKGRKAERLID